MAQKIITGFKDDDGVDIGDHLVPKDYLIERYPGLIPTEKSGGLFFAGDKLFAETTRYTSTMVQTDTGGTNWKQISAGRHHRSAIKSDGTLWSWGGSGKNGDNTTLCRASPVQTIAGGNNWSCVISEVVVRATKTDGTLWVWGGGGNGELGLNDTLDRLSPVQVGANTNWKSPNGIKTDGTLWTWGVNTSGKLGVNDTLNRSSPVQVGTGTTWKEVCLTDNSGSGIKTDGTLWTWGVSVGGPPDMGGQNKSSPVQFGSSTNWKQISVRAGLASAIKTDGTLWTWTGKYSVNFGQHGDNTIIERSSPTQTIAGGTNWKCVEVIGGGGVLQIGVMALKTDGSLWAWGTGNAGKSGLGDTINRSSPVQVGTIKSWKTIAGGQYFTASIREFGEEY